MSRLTRKFFNQAVVTVAQELLGKTLVVGSHRGIITETEAYHQHDDPACHAHRGKTPRNAVMFGPPGFSYVYFIYGMYYCLNVVTEAEGIAAAVLIRGVQTTTHHYNGPGKLCKAFGITKEAHNGIDLVTTDDFYILNSDLKPAYQATPRIGIRHGLDKMWRFVVNE